MYYKRVHIIRAVVIFILVKVIDLNEKMKPFSDNYDVVIMAVVAPMVYVDYVVL